VAAAVWRRRTPRTCMTWLTWVHAAVEIEAIFEVEPEVAEEEEEADGALLQARIASLEARLARLEARL
jgi:uncharacterized protein YceH (UPF0502 family)